MFFKAGYAGDDEPRIVFPTVVRASMKRSLAHCGTTSAQDTRSRSYYVGYEAEEYKELYHLNYPIHRGEVTNWDDMEAVSLRDNLYMYYNKYADLESYFLQRAACGTRGAPSPADRGSPQP